MYEYTDKALDYLDRRYITIFSRMKSVGKTDEITVLGIVEQIYVELLEITMPILLQIANRAYQRYYHDGILTEMWLEGFLEGFSPVTRYVFANEVERKKSRLFEAYVSSKGDPKEVDKALRFWSKMIAEYAVEITDAATLMALADSGISLVEWFTAEDERVCSVCGARHGHVYQIDSVPSKPHWGCRCYILPIQ